MSRVQLRLVLLAGLSILCAEALHKPNMVWFLTDDQDQMLGGSFPQLNGQGPMPKTQAMMADLGATAERFYIHTPICNPSRSELLSGRYFHNIKTTGTPWANMHVNETLPHNHSFMRSLHDVGYRTGMFGKFMNAMPTSVPPGYDAWLANEGGTYIAPRFQMHNVEGLIPGLVSGQGTRCWNRDHSGDRKYGCYFGTSDPSNYTTALVGNVSMAWIKKVVAEDPTKPFFAYIAPKAAHEPFNPAPWYEGHWDPSWPAAEPRPEVWNCSAESRSNHGSNIPTQKMLTDEAATVVTDVFKNRWRTLMSVDDVIGSVIELCEELGISNNTYFFYSSDHGFQLGELNILMDKRHVYEWDTHIHLLSRGPGIKPNTRWSKPATQVDMAPTFLGLAGLDRPTGFDGRSLVPLLIPDATNSGAIPAATVAHLRSLGDSTIYADSWRQTVLLEYYFNDPNVKCVASCKSTGQYPQKDASCGVLTPGANAQCWGGMQCVDDCYPTESNANNFIALRSMPDSPFGDLLYAEYQTGNQAAKNIDFSQVDFVELFNNTADPWQMTNLIKKGTPSNTTFAHHSKLHQTLREWLSCSGDSCW